MHLICVNLCKLFRHERLFFCLRGGLICAYEGQFYAMICTKTVARWVFLMPRRPISCIFIGCLKKKKYLCPAIIERKIKVL